MKLLSKISMPGRRVKMVSRPFLNVAPLWGMNPMLGNIDLYITESFVLGAMNKEAPI